MNVSTTSKIFLLRGISSAATLILVLTIGMVSTEESFRAKAVLLFVIVQYLSVLFRFGLDNSYTLFGAHHPNGIIRLRVLKLTIFNTLGALPITVCAILFFYEQLGLLWFLMIPTALFVAYTTSIAFVLRGAGNYFASTLFSTGLHFVLLLPICALFISIDSLSIEYIAFGLFFSALSISVVAERSSRKVFQSRPRYSLSSDQQFAEWLSLLKKNAPQAITIIIQNGLLVSPTLIASLIGLEGLIYDVDLMVRLFLGLNLFSVAINTRYSRDIINLCMDENRCNGINASRRISFQFIAIASVYAGVVLMLAPLIWSIIDRPFTPQHVFLLTSISVYMISILFASIRSLHLFFFGARWGIAFCYLFIASYLGVAVFVHVTLVDAGSCIALAVGSILPILSFALYPTLVKSRFA